MSINIFWLGLHCSPLPIFVGGTTPFSTIRTDTKESLNLPYDLESAWTCFTRQVCHSPHLGTVHSCDKRLSSVGPSADIPALERVERMRGATRGPHQCPCKLNKYPGLSPETPRGVLDLVPSTVLECTIFSRDRGRDEGPGNMHAPACIAESVDRAGATVQAYFVALHTKSATS